MSTPLLVVCTLLYVGTSVDLLLRGQFGLALTFAAYALANIGLILAVGRAA